MAVWNILRIQNSNGEMVKGDSEISGRIFFWSDSEWPLDSKTQLIWFIGIAVSNPMI